jgi:hypothetical protein
MSLYQDDFNLVVYSDRGAGTSRCNLTYSFDFSRFLNGRYKMFFSFIAGNNDIDPARPACIHVDFNQQTYEVVASGAGIKKSSFIGIASNRIFSTSEGYCSSTISENAFSIVSFPPPSTFTVKIYDPTTGLIWVDNVGNDMASYILTLYFKKIPDI